MAKQILAQQRWLHTVWSSIGVYTEFGLAAGTTHIWSSSSGDTELGLAADAI